MDFPKYILTVIVGSLLVGSLAVAAALLPIGGSEENQVSKTTNISTIQNKTPATDKKNSQVEGIDLLFFTLEPKHITEDQIKTDTTATTKIEISPEIFTESENFFQQAILESNPEICKKITDVALSKRCKAAFYSNKSGGGLESFLLKLTTW